jgi:hypothetical protein
MSLGTLFSEIRKAPLVREHRGISPMSSSVRAWGFTQSTIDPVGALARLSRQDFSPLFFFPPLFFIVRTKACPGGEGFHVAEFG